MRGILHSSPGFGEGLVVARMTRIRFGPLVVVVLLSLSARAAASETAPAQTRIDLVGVPRGLADIGSAACDDARSFCRTAVLRALGEDEKLTRFLDNVRELARRASTPGSADGYAVAVPDPSSLKLPELLALGCCLSAGDCADEVTVPKIHDNLSTKRVLTMQFADGTRVDNVEKMRENKVDTYKVAKTIQKAFATLTFEHGFAHGDPHPGNLLVDDNGKVTILDHGVVRRLDEKTRETWCQVWLALIRNDENEMRNAVEKLGINPEMHKFFGIILALAPARVIEDRFKKEKKEADGTLSSTSSSADVVVAKNTSTREDYKTNADSLSTSDKREIFKTVLKVKLEDQSQLFESLPRDLLMVLKANNLLRYVNEQLGSPVNRYRVIARSAKNGLEKREQMKNDAEQALEIDSARKKGLGYRTKEWARTITDRGYDNVMVMLLPAQLFFTRGKLAWAFWRSSKAAKSSALVSNKSTVVSTTGSPATERKT